MMIPKKRHISGILFTFIILLFIHHYSQYKHTKKALSFPTFSNRKNKGYIRK
ncbi:hypothetical protein PRABACTJOHN_02634 [Parabacteroides johnsonii DSM 18315]|uniref:Uncharacterized protein n=1 Tax=Parabacteroides johnsonii DSM 18315 TaxID=537006 RepID=B7BC68_9BACT|nr:hypothetical protein PRABACTJOHN_02634 [Parabacteroides johnsonii DSM 18315]